MASSRRIRDHVVRQLLDNWGVLNRQTLGSNRLPVMVDYWFAAWFGRRWLAVRRRAGLLEISAGLPELCARVARGERLPASELGMAEDFATAMWWRSALAVLIPFLAVGLAAKGWVHGTALDAVGGLLVALIFYMGMALFQAVMAFVRAGFNRAYLRRAGPEAMSQPLPTLELGVPRRWDFWAVLAFSTVTCTVLSYAGLHGAPH